MTIFDKIACRLCKQFKLCNQDWNNKIIEKYQVRFWYIDPITNYYTYPDKFYSKESAEKFAVDYLEDFSDIFYKWELIDVQ